MNVLQKIISLSFVLLLGSNLSTAQNSTEKKGPRDGFYDRYLHTEKMPIAYDYIHEKDVFWEKRVWRELPLNEQRNHAFKNPKRPFVQLLLEAARTGEIGAYSTFSDDFSDRLSSEEAALLGIRVDTIHPFLGLKMKLIGIKKSKS